MSSGVTFVVEGRSDAVLFKKLLSETSSLGFRFFVGGGRASLATVARNILAHEGGPLVIIMDADTLDLAQADSNCLMVRAALRSFSAAGGVEVFAFVPEQEVVFFEAPSVLQRRFGKDRVQQHLLERGLLAPKDTLLTLLRESGVRREVWFKELTEEDGKDLQRGTQATQLIRSVQALVDGARA